MSTAPTVRDLLLGLGAAGHDGLRHDSGTCSWAQVVQEGADRAAALRTLLDDDLPPHVGVLLDNVPDFLLTLGAAALGGLVVVGLNPTRRGPALAGDARRTDCQVVLTDTAHRPLLEDLDGVRVLCVDGPEWRDLLARHAGSSVPDVGIGPDTLLMLIFTSGTSGDPKAVRVTHAKVAGPGVMLGERFGLGHDDVAYLSMPLFHSNAVMAGWAPALAQGATVALARFSASGFIADARRFEATYANYVGKPLSYVLATPEQPDDADNPLRLLFGNEANDRAIEEFSRRFGCTVVDSYSSTENAVIVQRLPDMPAGSLGRPLPGIKVLDPETGIEVPDARIDAAGRVLNPDEATGELVNTEGAGAFAGYYNDPDAEAERMRDGMYWSGDLAYRDADGWVYFAGRSADWMRVDGENLAAAPLERIWLRHPRVQQVAVYAVPDPGPHGVGDQVMAALLLDGDPGDPGDPGDLSSFLDAQRDLPTKGRPRWIRLLADLDELPRTATTKILKRDLIAQGVTPGRGRLLEREERGTDYETTTGEQGTWR
ncbi:long-chain-fatty-acid--CoA ligase [Nocardioides acrostichi]|uniref:AMP-binding protein n=1 Tax=Nocardioides acrostichi TaxID=2784339 RepID=A0A930UWC0_9ACTN|nr:long-chain-fatty-acid--CoA ligase [Nocardioides acrostichi]MBF4162063.1 AMP-binding protein [Nocardioides acrostichi]